MLWSLLKTLIFIALVAVVTFGAGLLMETDGVLRLAVGGTEFTLTPLAGTVVALLIMLGVWLTFKLAGLSLATVRFLTGDETAISRFFYRNRERRGYQALSEGLIALASGEARLAQTKADRAARLLPRDDLTKVLNAQAAELAGDSARATKIYREMLGDDRTRFVGVRGLMQQKLAAGETDTAKALAEKAFALNDRHKEVQDTLFGLQAQSGDWQAARQTLAAMLKTGTLPREVYRRRDAVLTYARARDALAAGDLDSAEKDAVEANRLAPALIPAAALAGRVLHKAGKTAQARKLLRKAWEAEPHPALAEAFAAQVPDETPADRLERFGPWLSVKPDSPETGLLAAELHLAADDPAKARKLLQPLLDEDAPDARGLALMAAVEKASGTDEHQVRAWLARAVDAPRGPQWTCDACHAAQPEWSPVCDSCGAFDTLAWDVPADAGWEPGLRSALLPLLASPDPAPPATAPDPAPVAADITVDAPTDRDDDDSPDGQTAPSEIRSSAS